MISPSPQCVGQEFVRQYYTMLHEAPGFMHRFYSHDSSFIHGGHADGSVYGQINIHKKILSLNFRDCHARIRQVDSLGTIDNAVVVQVSGELSNDGQPMRRFMQTFVLAPQSPKKYYVHNDIFRYQDEVFVEDCDLSGTTPCTSSADSPESCYLSSFTKFQEHQSSSDQSVHNSSLNSPTKGKVLQSQVTQPAQNEDLIRSKDGLQNSQPERRSKMDVGDRNESCNGHRLESANAGAVSNDRGRVHEDGRCGETEGHKNGRTAITPCTTSGGKTPLTWASVMSGKKTQSATSYGCAGDGKTSGHDGGPRLSYESPLESYPPKKRSDDCRISEVHREVAEEETFRGRTTWIAEASKHRSESVQLFVGNLPNDVAASTLKKIFGKFGEVLDVRINRKVSSNRDVPNFGFISLESLDAARKILEARPFYLDNGHRLNVEEKKSDQLRFAGNNAALQQRNRPSPTTRPSSSGRGWWGGYKGGDGRSGSSSKSFDKFGNGPSGGFKGKAGPE